MPSRTGKVYVDVYAQTAPAEKALLRIQKIANNPLNLNIRGSSYSGPLGKITGQVSEFEKSLEASNARVTAFGASAGLIYGVSRAFEALVRSTIEVQRQLNDINVILNTNNESFAQFSNELFNIANKTGQSFKTAAEAALELARQGLGVEATLKRTNAALALTRISGLSAAESVEAITAAINSFNKSALDDITLVSKLSNVDTRFAVSSQDLAEALSRVGSTAQDAGLNIDELIGLVTAVQQTTSRGGAVIGNAFKNIFTRLSRSDTIEQLKALGVQIDSTQTGLQKLNAISQAIQNVGIDQANTIKELSGGVYQINVVSAALSDLSKAYSLTSQATKIAGESTNEAEVRIKELNKTLSALLNETVNNLTRFGSKIGESAFVPNFDTLLKNINELLVNSTNAFGETGDDAGFSFAEAFFKGFGQFISGPALGFATVLISKLFLKLASFVGRSVIKLVQVNEDLTKQTQLINFAREALLSEQSIMDGIRNKTISVADAHDRIVNKLREINNLRQIELGLINQTSKALVTSGFKITQTPIGSQDYPTLVQQVQPSKKKGAAEGFIPNFNMAAMMEKMGAYAGGYKPGAIKTTNISKVGKVVYNSAEQIKKFPGFDQPAIIPPKDSEAGKNYRIDFVDKLGFDPYHNKANGFVPNFLPTNILSSFRDTLKFIQDKKYNLVTSIQSDYPNAKSSTIRGSYNSTKDSIKVLDSLDDFDKISTLGHESIHRVIGKSGLAPKFADMSNKIFGQRKRYGPDLMNIPTIRRVRGAKDIYEPSSYLEEMFADISSASIVDKQKLGKLLKLQTQSGELYPKKLKTAFRLSQRLIKASKQSLFSADGFVPNFVPPYGKMIGEGVYGRFIDLQKSFKGVKIGKKVLHDSRPSALLEDVSNEFAGHQQLSSLKLPPFLALPKLIGNKARSIKRGYIGKEVISGSTFRDIEEKYLDYRDNIKDLSAKQKLGIYDFAQRSQDQAYYSLLGQGVNVRDFRNGGNVIFNDEFIKKTEQIARRNPKLIHELANDPKKLVQVLNSLGKKGAKLFAIDTDISQFTKANNGLIPNFAKLYTRRQGINPKKINPKLSQDIQDDFDFINPNKRPKIPNLIDKNGIAQIFQIDSNQIIPIQDYFSEEVDKAYFQNSYSTYTKKSKQLNQSKIDSIDRIKNALKKYYPEFAPFLNDDLISGINPKFEKGSTNLDILKSITSIDHIDRQPGTQKQYLKILKEKNKNDGFDDKTPSSYFQLLNNLKKFSIKPFESLKTDQIKNIFPKLDDRYLKLPNRAIKNIVLGENPYETINNKLLYGNVIKNNKELLKILESSSTPIKYASDFASLLYPKLDKSILNHDAFDDIGRRHDLFSFLNNNIQSEQFTKKRIAYGAAGQRREYTYKDLISELQDEDLTNGAKSSVTKVFENLQNRLSASEKAKLEERIKRGKNRIFPITKLNKDTNDVKILRNELQLFEEGEKLGHCVGGYGNACYYPDEKTGLPKSLIVSTGNTTAELNPNIKNNLVDSYQIQGKNNSAPSEEEIQKIRNFVTENGFIPNFVNPKNRYTLGYNKFRPNLFGIKDLLSDPKDTLSKLPFRVAGSIGSAGIGLFKKYIQKQPLESEKFFAMSRYLSGMGGVKNIELGTENQIKSAFGDLVGSRVKLRLRDRIPISNYNIVYGQEKDVPSNTDDYPEAPFRNLIGAFRLGKNKKGFSIQDAFDFDNSTNRIGGENISKAFSQYIDLGDKGNNKVRQLFKKFGKNLDEFKIGPIKIQKYVSDNGIDILGDDLDIAKYGSPFLTRINFGDLPQKLQNQTGRSNGFIPNFAMPIAGLENAIDREISAGVPKSAVRIGKHSTLISTKNPQGFGVYNTIHEPKGLIQGIQRSKAFGINPKIHGASEGLIPNFAPSIKPPKAPKVAIFDPTNLPKSFQKVNTPTSTTQFSLNKVAGPPISEEFIGKVNEKIIEVVKNIDAFGAEWTKTSQFRKLSKELDGLVSSVTSNKTVFNTIKNTFKKAATDAADYQKSLKTYNTELAKAQTIEQERRQNLVIEASKFRIFPSKKAKAAEAELTQIAKTDPTAFNQLQDITRRRDEQRAQVGLAASFIVPIVTSAISEAAGTSTPERRKVGASADFIGSIASSAALGSTIGPQGTIAGLLFGFGLGIDKFAEQITTTLPELEKEFDRSSQKLEQFNNAISQYGSALEKYQGALSDISGSISNQDIEKFRKNTIGRLLDIPVEFRSQIAAASGSISSLNDVVAELGKKLSDDEKIKKFSLALQEIFESSRKITYLDFITLDPKDPKFKQNKEEISKILSSTIDPKIISEQSNKIIDLAKKVQFEGGNGIQELLINLESIGKIPASITEKLGNISKGGGGQDAKQVAKLIEDVFKSFESTKKFTDIAEKSRKSLSELTAQFNVTISNIQKQLSLLVSSLGAEASQSAKSILTKNKLGRGNEQFNIQRSLTRAEGSLKLGEQFLSPKALLNFNSSLEESQNKFDKLKSIQDAVGQAQEKSLSIFTDELLKAGSDLSELGKKAADRNLTPEDKITQVISEKNLDSLIKAFESIAIEVANNPSQAVPTLSKDLLKSFNISDNLTQEILLKSNDVLVDLKNEILSINEISNQNNELLKINNEYNAKLIAQQAKLNQFGGIKTFIDRSSLSEFESLIKEGAGLRFGGNSQDQGVFSAKLIDLLGDPNKLNLRGEQIPKPLFEAARLGRTQSIIQDIDYTKIAAQLSGAFDTEQLSALDSLKNLAPEIADIQVKSLAKFDSLPDVTLDINYNILELNKQLGEYINSYVDKNEISFRNALDSSKVSSFIGNIQETTKAILQKNQEIIELNRNLEIEQKRSEISNLQQNRVVETSAVSKDFLQVVQQLNLNFNKIKGNEQAPEDIVNKLTSFSNRANEIRTGSPIQSEDITSLVKFIKSQGLEFTQELIKEGKQTGRSNSILSEFNPNITEPIDLLKRGKVNTDNINFGGLLDFNDKTTALDSRIAELNKNISALSKSSTLNISNIIPTLSSENITPIYDIPATPSAPKSTVVPDNLKDVYSKLDKIKKMQSEQIALEEQKKNLLDNELKNTLALAQSLYNIKNVNKENNAQYEIALKALNEMRELKLEQEFRNAQVEVDALSQSSHVFAEEIAQARKEANTLKARLGELTPGDLGKQFLDSWHTNFATFKRDLNDGVAEIGYTMKDSFKEGFKEFIKGTKDANEALRDFALNVANKALDIATNIAFDQIFSAVGKGLNSIGTSFGTKNKTVSTGATGGRVTNAGIKGYATGGLVTGGSGNKDDVAAMLSPGEYVIKQDSVKALGTDLLDKLNEQRINPTTIKKLDNGVDATFLNDLLYEGSNINKPTDAKLIFDPNLSSYALTDENNPANARRFQKEEELISYLQGNAAYERQKKEALRQFKRGKEQSFYSQLIAAAVSSAAGAYNQYGNQQKTNSLGRSTSDPYGLETTNNKQYNQVLRNKGGIIPKYANGGYHTDNIPALLTGGEYVISKEAVRKYGMDFFDKVNGKRFADGGPVDYNTRTGISTAPVGNDIDSELSASINRMSAATEALSSLLSNNTGGNGSVVATQNNAVQPNVNITINVADNGKVSAQSNSNVSGNDNNKSSEENRKTTVDQSKQLTQLIQSEVIKIIQQQQRDGGLLSSARPR